MALFSFGPWRPDLGDIAELDDSAVMRLAAATNVVPEVGCYQPQASSVPVTSSITSTCQGALACTDKDGNVNWFAGTATKLKRISTATITWETVGSGFHLGEEQRWSIVKYGNLIFACASTDDIQYMTMSAGSVFQPVTGAPRFKSICVVRNFLVGCGAVTDPQRVQWSGLDRPLSWTVDASTLADFQDLLGDGGINQGMVAGLAGADAAIIQERSIWRMLYVGLPLVFQFDPVEASRGAVSAGSIVQSSGYVFYYSDNGFYRFDGTTSIAIGSGKVDNFFIKYVDSDRLESMSAIADADRSLVLWSYKSVGSVNPDCIIVHNWQTGDWSIIEHDCTLLWRSLQIHNAPLGIPAVASFDTLNRATIFLGDNLEARISTAEHQINPNGRTLITEIYPIVDGDAPYTQITHRENSTVSLVSGPVSYVNSSGFSPMRVDDRFIQIHQTIPAASTWFRWKGIKITNTNTGTR